MIKLIALLLGLFIGMLIKRQFRPLLLENWRALPLLPMVLAASMLPAIFASFWPDQIWTQDRSLLISLIAFQYLLAIFFLLINCLPVKSGANDWINRIPLLIVCCGLFAEAAVHLLNHGYMPISAKYLDSIDDPAVIMGIQNQAFYLKQLIGPDTRLAWLGQIWHWDFLVKLKMTQFPYISPAEVLTALGLFLTGLGQFIKIRPAATGPEREGIQTYGT